MDIDGRCREGIRGSSGNCYFCLEVYLADVRISLVHSNTLPTVIFSLLDFEPIVFELHNARLLPSKGSGSRFVGYTGSKERPVEQDRVVDNADQVQYAKNDSEENNKNKKNTAGNCTDHLTYFSIRRGKSCVFTANPANLSRVVRRVSSLTLMVVSRLSPSQAFVHGSCPIGLSSFGPDTELSHFLPHAVSSWGHSTNRFEISNLQGRAVATVDLTVSLSCMGLTGPFLQPIFSQHAIGNIASAGGSANAVVAAVTACPTCSSEEAPNHPSVEQESSVRSMDDFTVRPYLVARKCEGGPVCRGQHELLAGTIISSDSKRPVSPRAFEKVQLSTTARIRKPAKLAEGSIRGEHIQGIITTESSIDVTRLGHIGGKGSNALEGENWGGNGTGVSGGETWTCKFSPQGRNLREIAPPSTVLGSTVSVKPATDGNGITGGSYDSPGGAKVKLSTEGTSSKIFGVVNCAISLEKKQRREGCSKNQAEDQPSVTPALYLAGLVAVSPPSEVAAESSSKEAEAECLGHDEPDKLEEVEDGSVGQAYRDGDKKNRNHFGDAGETAAVDNIVGALKMAAETAVVAIIPVKAMPDDAATRKKFPGNNCLHTSWRPDKSREVGKGGFGHNGEFNPTLTPRILSSAGKRPRAGTRTTKRRSTSTLRQQKKEKPGKDKAIVDTKTTTKRSSAAPQTFYGKTESVQPQQPLWSSKSHAVQTRKTSMTEGSKVRGHIQRQRQGKTQRIPWGAGPGALASPGPSVSYFMPQHDDSSQEKRSSDGGSGGSGTRGSGGVGGGVLGQNLLGRRQAWPLLRSRPQNTPVQPSLQTRMPLGTTAVRQFLPTWTSLVAEAAWLHGTWGEGECGDTIEGRTTTKKHDAAISEASLAKKNHDLVVSDGGDCGAGRKKEIQPPLSGIEGHPNNPRFEDNGKNSGEDRETDEPGGAWVNQNRDSSAPLLDPDVEKLLMDWLKPRIDRNGRVYLSSADTPTGMFRTRHNSTTAPGNNHLDKNNRERDRMGPSERPEGQSMQGHIQGRVATTTSPQRPTVDDYDREDPEGSTKVRILCRLFDEALTGLLKEHTAAAMVARSFPDRSIHSGQEVPSGVGWVEVVRRVSMISKERALTTTIEDRPHVRHPVAMQTHQHYSKGVFKQQELNASTDQAASQMRRQDNSNNKTETSSDNAGAGQHILSTSGHPEAPCLGPIRGNPRRSPQSPQHLPPLHIRSPPPSPIPPTMPISQIQALNQPVPAHPPPPRDLSSVTASPISIGSPRASRWLMDGVRGSNNQKDYFCSRGDGYSKPIAPVCSSTCALAEEETGGIGFGVNAKEGGFREEYRLLGGKTQRKSPSKYEAHEDDESFVVVEDYESDFEADDEE